jgi:anti-anti-sigma factor
MVPRTMNIEKQRNGDYILVSFGAARLDPANSTILRQELLAELETSPVNMIVDMHEVVYAVSPAVNVILDAHERCRRAGRNLILIRVQPSVRRILSLSGLTSVLVMQSTLEEALELLSRQNDAS